MAWGESCQDKFDFYTKFLINMIGAVVVNMILLLLMYGHPGQPLVDTGCRCTCNQLALTHCASPFCLAVHCQDAASKRVQSRGCELSVTAVALGFDLVTSLSPVDDMPRPIQCLQQGLPGCNP